MLCERPNDRAWCGICRISLAFILTLAAISNTLGFGQVIQLPTYRVFGIQTSVLVPDQGGVTLGGIGRAGNWGVSRGVPLAGRLPGVLRSRAGGAAHSAAAVDVRATVIDHRQWDLAIRSQAAAHRRRDDDDDELSSEAAFLSRHVSRRDAPTDASVRSAPVVTIRRPAAAPDENEQFLDLIRQGDASLAAGKHQVAKICFRTAARHASGQLRDLALQRYRAVPASR